MFWPDSIANDVIGNRQGKKYQSCIGIRQKKLTTEFFFKLGTHSFKQREPRIEEGQKENEYR